MTTPAWTTHIPDSLPAGVLAVPDEDFTQGESAPVMWLTSEPVHGSLAVWHRLFDQRHSTGLYPLILPERAGLAGRPWLNGELEPVTAADVATCDVAALLRERWQELVAASRAQEVDLAWTGHGDGAWPGPVPAIPLAHDPSDVSALLADLPAAYDHCRIGLVPADSGSAAMAVVGWMGAVNHFATVAPLAAVVRSWEERFGFRVVALGFDTIVGSHALGPLSADGARAIGVEHYLACPDELDQNYAGDVAGYLTRIAHNPGWALWWD
jgi:hypothetical protein